MLHPAPMDALRSRLRKRGVAICLSGIDGSGKTTLAQQLVGAMAHGGLPARHLHVYQWYLNALAMPLVLLYNRHIGRKVLVLDRSVFDNIAVLALSPRCPRWLPRTVLKLALALYPKFDYCFYLVADFNETLRRRPDTREQAHAELTSAYERITAHAGHVRLRSDPALFGEVLRRITAAATNPTDFLTENE
jgi:thymidylate kinase